MEFFEIGGRKPSLFVVINYNNPKKSKTKYGIEKKKHQRKEKFADLSQCLDKRFLLSEVRLHLAPHFKIICNLKKSIK